MLFSFAIFIVQIITMEGNQKNPQRESVYTTQRELVFTKLHVIYVLHVFLLVVWSLMKCDVRSQKK